MHDLKLIVEQPELYTDMASRRGATDVDVNHVIELDSERKSLLVSLKKIVLRLSPFQSK